MSLDGDEYELGIVPYSLLGRPLEQVVDRGVRAAVVKVLLVEGTAHDAAVDVQHLDLPILATVRRVRGFGPDARVVASVVAIAQHEALGAERLDAVGGIDVEASHRARFEKELGGAVSAGLGLVDELDRAVGFHAGSQRRTVGRHEQAGLARRFDEPELRLV